MRSFACLLALTLVALPEVSEAAAPAPPDPLPAFLVGAGTMLFAPSIGGLPVAFVGVAVASLAPGLLVGALTNPLVWAAGAALLALPMTWISAFTISLAFEGAGHAPDFMKTWLVGAAVAFVGIMSGLALIASVSALFGGILLLGGLEYVFVPFVQTWVAARFPLTPAPAAGPPTDTVRPEMPGNR